MAPRAQAAPRKVPIQARSQATVDAILDAAAALLEESGLDGLTTNHVAERAGVSVGSLYQYFPNKDAIVVTLLERHLREADALRPAALSQPGLALEKRVRLVVDWFLAVHAAAPELHRSLTVAAPAVLGDERVRQMERLFQRGVLEALRPYANEIRNKDLELAAFIVAHCLEALTHGAVIHHPELLVGGRLGGEIADLLVGYLRGR